MADVRTVGPRIRAMLPELSPLEVRVADWLLGATELDETTPLKAVARATAVSEPLIVKTAKKLGFDGFRELRKALADYRRLPGAGAAELSPDDTPAETCAKVFRASMRAIEETLAILDMAAFEKAAGLLARARQRDWYGVGGSAQIARDAAHKFLRVGVRCTVHDDPHMMLMSAAILRPRDVVIGVSHSGRTAPVLEAVERARTSGASVIALTNYPQSPLAQLADAVLCSTAQGSPLIGEYAAARVAQLTLLDALVVRVAQQDHERAEGAVVRTMAAVGSRRP